VVNKIFIFLLPLIFVSCLNKQDKKVITLNIYAHSSFIGVYGPGPKIKSLFEKNYPDIEINFNKIKNSSLIVTQVNDDYSFKKNIDIVIGFDQILLNEINIEAWEDLTTIKTNYLSQLESFKKDRFIIYDWAPLGFLSRDSSVKNIKDLTTKDHKYTFPNPKTSSPGLHLFVSLEKNRKLLTNIKSNVYKSPSSWSQSYGLFSDKTVDTTFTYLTSKLYHLWNQKINDLNIVKMDKYSIQVEYAGLYKKSNYKKQARIFLEFLLSNQVQEILMKKNFMIPSQKSASIPNEVKKIIEFPTLNFNSYKNWTYKKVIKTWKSIN
jgi:thiamine transport system substrate-binding protein